MPLSPSIITRRTSSIVPPTSASRAPGVARATALIHSAPARVLPNPRPARINQIRQSPGGESIDGMIVWLPEEKTVLTGNLTGAIYGALPHLSTIRGDRPRSAHAASSTRW